MTPEQISLKVIEDLMNPNMKHTIEEYIYITFTDFEGNILFKYKLPKSIYKHLKQIKK